MKEVRIIPCLDVKEGRVVKGVNFVNLRDARDPVEAAAAYCREGADELVFLDILATVQERKTRTEWVKRVAEVALMASVSAVQSVLSLANEQLRIVSAGVTKSVQTAPFCSDEAGPVLQEAGRSNRVHISPDPIPLRPD